MAIPQKNTAGGYDQRVQVQKLVPGLPGDDAAEVDETNSDNWAPYCNRWARKENIGGNELQEAKQVVARGSSRLFLRYDSYTAAITTKMRVIWKDRTFHIEACDEIDGQNREVFIDLTEAK